MQSLAPAANLLASVTSSSLKSVSLDLAPDSQEGFEAHEIPGTVTVFHTDIELVLAVSDFLAVVSSDSDSTALDAARVPAVARPFNTLPLYLSSTGRAAPTIERLGRDTKCTIFLTTRETSAKDLEAVSNTAAALRAIGITARAYSVPRAHANVSDWLLAAGADRVILALSAAADRTVKKNTEKVLSGGYIPLGKIGANYMCWSNDFSEVQALSTTGYTQAGALMTLAGEEWLRKKFPRRNERGTVVGFDNLAAAGVIRDECARLKVWDRERIRLSGVWKQDGEYVVNSDQAWFVNDGAPVPRTGNRIYAAGKDLDITPDVTPATVDDGRAVLDFLHTFNWASKARRDANARALAGEEGRKDTDPLMVMGALFLMYLCAALPQRPHTFVQADFKSGKSVLLTFAKLMLGGAVFSSSGSSGSGVSSDLLELRASIAAILDESGYDAAHIASLMDFLKLAYDGRKKSLGSSDQKGVQLQIRTICLVAGTIAPNMDAQLVSRMNLLKMSPWPIGTRPPKHPFYTHDDDSENALVSDLGKRMFMRTLQSAQRFERAVELLKAVALGSQIEGRDANTMVPAMGGSFCMLHDQEMTPETAHAWFDRFDMTGAVNRANAMSTSDEIKTFISTTNVKTDAAGDHTMPIAELWHRAACDTPRGRWRQSLGMHGMRIDKHEDGTYTLGLAHRSRGLEDLFSTSKWAKVDLESLVKRLDFCSATFQKGSMASGSETYYTVPWSMPTDDNGNELKPTPFAQAN